MKRNVYLFFLILFLHTLTTKAQLCTGTPGAPIFKETFGAGIGAGTALPAGNTTYTYTPGWPSDGQYTIANTSNPTPGNTHWMTGADHTGDKNGYMFVVNASYAPGEFFRHSVTGLCANTTYVFSAWIANVNDTSTVTFCKKNDPPYVFSNVLFKIENPATGNVNSISTGNITPGNTNIEWHEFGFTFATGPGQTVVDLVMVNNSPGGCGNDLVIDDISFRPCGPNTSVVAIPSKQFYCSGDSIMLDATIGPGYNSPVYQWQFSTDGTTWTDIPGATGQDLKLNPVAASQTGKYRLLLAESGNISLSKCRVITDVLTLKIIQSPPVVATATPASICSGNKSTLVVTGANTYLWTPTGDKTTTVTVDPTANTTYTVIGKDTLTGCVSKATVSVVVNAIPISPVVAGPDSICSGNAVTLTATAPGGTYKWYEVAKGGTPVFIGAVFQTPILNTSKTYYVEAESSFLCASASRTTVRVKVGITPSNAVVIGPDSICSGNSATLTATSPGGTYKWYKVSTGGTPVFIGTIFQTPILNADITYYVEVESAVSCLSTSRTPVKVIVHATPVSPVVATTDTICARNAVTLIATAPGGTYKWYETATGGTPVYTGDTFLTPVLNSTKTYYVEVESASKCTSTSRTPVTVPVSEVRAQFKATPSIGEAPLLVDFINTSTGSIISYQWDLGNQFISTSKNVSYTFVNTEEGSTIYEVTLIVINDFGCADTAKVTITVDPHFELIIPNIFTPNDDGINDLFTLKSSGLNLVQAQLFNRWGLQMYEWNSIHGGWDGRTSTGLLAPEGTYFYIIKAKGEGVTEKNYEFKGSFTLLR